ncbi:unknown [Bacteroides sp. CAG:1060]|nr:unknown [Bacteroides sp. CAG:1060]
MTKHSERNFSLKGLKVRFPLTCNYKIRPVQCIIKPDKRHHLLHPRDNLRPGIRNERTAQSSGSTGSRNPGHIHTCLRQYLLRNLLHSLLQHFHILSRRPLLRCKNPCRPVLPYKRIPNIAEQFYIHPPQRILNPWN